MLLVQCVLLLNVIPGRTSLGNGNSRGKKKKSLTHSGVSLSDQNVSYKAHREHNQPSHPCPRTSLQESRQSTYRFGLSSWQRTPRIISLGSLKCHCHIGVRAPYSRRTRKVASHHAPPSSMNCLILHIWVYRGQYEMLYWN